MKCSSHWLEILPENESLDILRELAYSHALQAGPFAEVLTSMIHKCQFRDLCKFEVDYSLDGLTPHAVKHARQAVAFFSKLRHLNIGVNREEVGMSKFLEAEELCKETNLRLEMRRSGTLVSRNALRLASCKLSGKFAEYSVTLRRHSRR
jgi:hypothetical protein